MDNTQPRPSYPPGCRRSRAPAPIGRALPSAQSDIQRARNFYLRHDALTPYVHCHDVYRTAVRFGIIDEGIIRDRRAEEPLRQSHMLRRRLALMHALDSKAVGRTPGIMPKGFADERLLEELDIFEKLTALARRGAPRDEFLALLNVERRPLAPLIIIPDCALTHDTEDALDGFIAGGRPSIIRQYASMEDARQSMRIDLRAAERIWAPLAGFYGFQELSGDIFQQSYRVNHPDIYDVVMAMQGDEGFREKLGRTQAIARSVAHIIAKTFEAYGISAEVPLRKIKHPGKQMEKIRRILIADYDEFSGLKKPPLSEFMTARIPTFDFTRFQDLVAVRAVISSFGGRDIDVLVRDSGPAVEQGAENKTFDLSGIGDLLSAIRAPALKLAVKIVADVFASLPLLHPESVSRLSCNVEFKRKANGYQAIHFDSAVEGPGARHFLPFELQMRTAEWHYLSERGGSAHYFYKDSADNPIDHELITALGEAYSNMLKSPPSPSSPMAAAPPGQR
jgi:hypothetical protein